MPTGLARFPNRSRPLLLLAEATAALAMASVKLRLLPFRYVVRQRAGRHQPRAAETKIAELQWAVGAAGRRVPFRAKCLEQALALRAMLLRRGHSPLLHYGIRNDAAGLAAHAWLSLDGQVVIGGATVPDVTEVATFGREQAGG